MKSRSNWLGRRGSALLAILDAHNQAYYKKSLSRRPLFLAHKLSFGQSAEAGSERDFRLSAGPVGEARRKIERVAWRLTSDHTGKSACAIRIPIVHPDSAAMIPRRILEMCCSNQ